MYMPGLKSLGDRKTPPLFTRLITFSRRRAQIRGENCVQKRDYSPVLFCIECHELLIQTIQVCTILIGKSDEPFSERAHKLNL